LGVSFLPPVSLSPAAERESCLLAGRGEGQFIKISLTVGFFSQFLSKIGHIFIYDLI
jgi:hypothetical protein